MSPWRKHFILLTSCFGWLMEKSPTHSPGIFFSKDPPESAGLCSDWTAADFAPSHIGWLARSSTASGWAGHVAHTGASGNTWPAGGGEE